ncbi:MAG: response regulator [Caulobacteraceae bacterium]
METRIRQPGAFYYVMQENLRILFVDDDPILREFAAVHLAADNVEIETAGDGLEALEKIRERHPDVVLLDLEMPRMDGFELLRTLRADPATLRLPVLVVTGREDVAAIDRAFEAGADAGLAGHSLKPALLPGALRPPHPLQ